MDFVVSAKHRVKIKESENIDKYSDLARERRKLWNMRVTMSLIVDSVLGTFLKILEREVEELEIGGRLETT